MGPRSNGGTKESILLVAVITDTVIGSAARSGRKGQEGLKFLPPSIFTYMPVPTSCSINILIHFVTYNIPSAFP